MHYMHYMHYIHLYTPIYPYIHYIPLYTLYTSIHTIYTSPVKEGPSSNSKFGYSFVTLSEEDESSGSFGIPSGLSQDKNKADSDHTINLSGIYAPPFEMIIDDQYVPDPHPSPMTNAFLGPSVQIQRSSYNSTVPR